MPPSKALLKELGVNTIKQTLHQSPPKEKGKGIPKVSNSAKNGTHQADLLFLPDDQGYKYALVVVDLHSGITDARPLKSKEPKEVTEALKEIYSSNAPKYLSMPFRIETDPGTEFKGQFKKFLESNGVTIRYGVTGRHRQQSVVEHRNSIIGEILNLRMAGLEQISGNTSRHWVEFLPFTIKAMNNSLPKKTSDQRFASRLKSNQYPFEIGGKPLLPVGTKVRVRLEQPKDYVSGDRLTGNFRKGDQRWETEPRKIVKVLAPPDQPVMYLVGTKEKPWVPEQAARTRPQLQVVTGNEPEPDPKRLNAPTFETYQVHSLQGKKKMKNRIHYHVRWIGFPDKKDWTWEPATSLKTNPRVKKLIEGWVPPP
jgi:hypothetical protein